MEQKDYQEFYTTQDPETGLPALTSLMYKLCNGDHDKFTEACRLVGLFIEQAKKEK